MTNIVNHELGQGTTFKFTIQITSLTTEGSFPVNITNQTFTGSLRENYTTTEVAAEFNIDKLSPYDSGSIQVYLTSEQTSRLTQRKYVYDVIMRDNSSPPIVNRLVEGVCTVRPAVTKDN